MQIKAGRRIEVAPQRCAMQESKALEAKTASRGAMAEE